MAKKQKQKIISKIKYKGLRFYNLLGSIINLTILTFCILFFIVNAQYKSDVYLVWTTLKNVSIATIMLISFLMGSLFAFILTVRQISKKKYKLKVQNKQNKKESV